MNWLIALGVIWVLLLLTGWMLFVAGFRLHVMRLRERRRKQVAALGAFAGASVDTETDGEAAWKEVAARRKAEWLKRAERREGATFEDY